MEFVVPHAQRERTIWPLMCVAIALLEESVYRGLFVLYLAALLGVSAWWFVVPMAVVFGLAHQYQGWFGVVASTALGITFGILTVGTGSLWPAIVGHAAFDLRLLSLRRPEGQPAAGGAGDAVPR